MYECECKNMSVFVRIPMSMLTKNKMHAEHVQAFKDKI